MRLDSVLKYAAMVTVLTLITRVASAQELLLDPPDLLNDFVSLGEFNADGDLEVCWVVATWARPSLVDGPAAERSRPTGSMSPAGSRTV